MEDEEVGLLEVSGPVNFLITQGIKLSSRLGWGGLGVNIDRLRRRVIEGIIEYAETGNKVIVTEVTITLRPRNVRDFVERVKRLRWAWTVRRSLP